MKNTIVVKAQMNYILRKWIDQIVVKIYILCFEELIRLTGGRCDLLISILHI